MKKPEQSAASKTFVMGVVRWLGGARFVNTEIQSEFDFITISHIGIRKGSIDELSRFIGVSRKVMAEDILDISIKTLERKTAKQKLDRRISSHALEIAKIMHHAYQVFEDDEKIKIWMNTANKALNGMKPVQLMGTLTGLVMINEVLGRIEEGIYS
jgi:putative toxin-antitoxin system antitoxin component (TIGR02293 family)